MLNFASNCLVKMSDKSSLFDTLVAQNEAPDCPTGGYRYVYTWSDDSRKNSWRSDGYRWRQNGMCKPNKQSNVTKMYFHVSVSLIIATENFSCIVDVII